MTIWGFWEFQGFIWYFADLVIWKWVIEYLSNTFWGFGASRIWTFWGFKYFESIFIVIWGFSKFSDLRIREFWRFDVVRIWVFCGFNDNNNMLYYAKIYKEICTRLLMSWGFEIFENLMILRIWCFEHLVICRFWEF